MSDPSATILGMTTWTKYTYVCDPDECDSLVEYTCGDTFGFPSGDVRQFTCPCGRNMQLLSVQPATIPPTTNKKEDKMETTQPYQVEQIRILQDTLKSHQNCDYWKEEVGRVQSQVISLINSAYAEETEASEILVELAEIVDYNPVKEVQFTATMSFTGSIQVPMSEADTFDISDILSEAYVDINHGDVVIDGYELYDAEEC